MLKYGEVNPLAVFGLRRITILPPHFERFIFDCQSGKEKEIVDWVWENLQGRFYFNDYFTATAAGQVVSSKVSMQKVMAFEDPAEASYFGLMLPTINSSSIVVFWKKIF